MRIISIGEILWDVYGDKEFVGGAPFNFSVHSRIFLNYLGQYFLLQCNPQERFYPLTLL